VSTSKKRLSGRDHRWADDVSAKIEREPAMGWVAKTAEANTAGRESALDGETPAWALSLAAHVALLLGLGFIGLPEGPRRQVATAIETVPIVEEPAIDIDLSAIAPSAEQRDAIGAESEVGDAVAQSVAAVVAEESVVPVETSEDPASEVKIEPLEALPVGLEADATMTVKGAVGVGTTGASGAVDRLTIEIAAALEQRPVLICWVFDRSVSLAAQRQEIAARLERVFSEINADGSEKNRPDLVHMIFAYGQTVRAVIDEPTRDPTAVVEAIRTIDIDDSGVEMTFTAIRVAAEKARPVRTGTPRRNAMIVAFTDEVGNDQAIAETTANACKSQGIPVYVVGVPAPFGRRDVKMKFVEFDPKYTGGEQWAEVDQGPETLYPEHVQVRSSREAEEAIESGFGPFSLCRLCAETGGIYFAVHANRGNRGRVSDAATAPMASRLRRFFDPEAMEAYRPDYVSTAKIDQMIFENRAVKALVEAARGSQIAQLEAPRTVFPREDEAALVTAFTEAQKAAARLQPKLDGLYSILNSGAADRSKIRSKRWQAGYDLAMGRVLAAKIRTDAYNIVLAQAKAGMKFKNANSDTWTLEPAADVAAVGSQTEKLAKQATMYLERTVQEHAGTPWAHLAAEELRIPLGYRWTESNTGVQNRREREGGNGGMPGLPADDRKQKLAPPKPSRPLKNL
jgi:hypothetical protein